MKFTLIPTVSMLLAASVSAQNATGPGVAVNGSNSNSNSSDSGISPADQCSLACKPEDVSCKAACLGNPNPNAADIAKNTECITKCNTDPNNLKDQPSLLACTSTCNAAFTKTGIDNKNTGIGSSNSSDKPKNANGTSNSSKTANGSKASNESASNASTLNSSAVYLLSTSLIVMLSAVNME